MLHDTAMSPDIVTACGQTNTRRKYLERVLVCVNCVKPCTSLEHAFLFRYFEFSVLAMLLFRVSLLSLRTRLNFCLSCVVNIEFGIRFWHWMSKKVPIGTQRWLLTYACHLPAGSRSFAQAFLLGGGTHFYHDLGPIYVSTVRQFDVNPAGAREI